MFRKITLITALLLILILGVTACGEEEEPTPTPVVLATDTPVSVPDEAELEDLDEGEEEVVVIVTPTPEATATPAEEPTAEPTEEATAEATPEATGTPAEEEATAEPTGEATAEATETPSEEATAEATPEATGTPAEEEATAEPTGEATAEATETPSEEATAEPTGEATAAPTGQAGEVDAQALVSTGQQVYSANCETCHGPEGEGSSAYPALAGNSFVTGDPGGPTQTVLQGAGEMPSFEGELSNRQIAAVLSYVRASWGNNAEAVSPDQVAQVAGEGQAQAAATEEATAQATGTPAEEAAAQETPTGEASPTAAGTPTGDEAPDEAETDKPSEVEATPTPAATMSPDQLTTAGEGLYEVYCAACHLPEGQGVQAEGRQADGHIYPPLAGNPFVTAEDPAAVIEVVLTGRAGMPRFRESITNQQIAAIVSYIRTAWDNDASTVTTAQVEQLLQEFLDRREFSDKEGSNTMVTPTGQSPAMATQTAEATGTPAGAPTPDGTPTPNGTPSPTATAGSNGG